MLVLFRLSCLSLLQVVERKQMEHSGGDALAISPPPKLDFSTEEAK